MKKIFSTFTIAGLLLASQPAAALTKKQVFAWTEIIALLSSAGVYLCAAPEYESPIKKGSLCGIKKSFRMPVGVAAGTFAGTNMFFGWLLSKWTPRSRYEWAQREVASFQEKYLFETEITHANIAEALRQSGCEANELPLVMAFLELQYFDQRLSYIADQLNRGMQDEGYSHLSKKMEEIRQSILVRGGHLDRIRASESVIKNQTQWLEQWKIHQDRVLKQQQMAQQAMQTHVVWHV